MLDRDHPTFVQWGPAVRLRFERITAFRLGYLVGESGEQHACPYDDERGRRCFEIGVECGRAQLGGQALRELYSSS